MENKNDIILEVKGLKKYFPLQKDIFGKPKAYLRAVDDVTFKLAAGKTIGVVGESGCGKTTLGRTILQLYDTTGGKTLYYGHSLEELTPKYYINGISNLPIFVKRFENYKHKLDLVLADTKFNKEYKTLSDYNSLLKEIETELSMVDGEDAKVLKRIKYVLVKLIDVLNQSSVLTGGMILAEVGEAKNLLLDIVYKKNELCKILKKSEKTENDLSKQEVLQLEIEQLINKKKLLVSDIVENELYKELEANLETGIDLARLTKEEMRSLRTEIQLIFQDPYSSLPPRMTIGSILTEPVKVHHIVEDNKVSEHVHKVMKMCGLQPQYYDRYPHEFSGGQRQRICIARALVVNPKLVICDEPVSALDVSIQAQIINLLKDLQKNLGLTYMFISHDLSVVKYITDSIIVMYLGNMMEIADTLDIFKNPLHPYTQALFSAVPVPDPDAKMNRIILKGDIPSPANPPKGCKFHTRCEKCMSVCKLIQPKFIQYEENHVVACHLYDSEILSNLEKYDLQLKELEKNEIDNSQNG